MAWPIFRGLFDDASLFPPASLPMADAIAGHLRHQAAWYHETSGPFVCADTKLTELSAALTAAGVAELDLDRQRSGDPERRRQPDAAEQDAKTSREGNRRHQHRPSDSGDQGEGDDEDRRGHDASAREHHVRQNRVRQTPSHPHRALRQ